MTGLDADAAIADLRALLISSLRYALAAHRVTEPDLEDFTQEALLMVLQKLDSFRGEACFTTWAKKVAVRVALSELRRRRWCDVSVENLLAEHEGSDFTPHCLVDPAPGPGQVTFKKMMLEWLQHIITQDLTDRQRCAMIMAMRDDVRPQDAAQLLDTNRNAIYKLLCDARRGFLSEWRMLDCRWIRSDSWSCRTRTNELFCDEATARFLTSSPLPESSLGVRVAFPAPAFQGYARDEQPPGRQPLYQPDPCQPPELVRGQAGETPKGFLNLV